MDETRAMDGMPARSGTGRRDRGREAGAGDADAAATPRAAMTVYPAVYGAYDAMRGMVPMTYADAYAARAARAVVVPGDAFARQVQERAYASAFTFTRQWNYLQQAAAAQRAVLAVGNRGNGTMMDLLAASGAIERGVGGERELELSKRQRLVWTPRLHAQFVDAVQKLGVKTAVPKAIMKIMNVEGLTRENVASHLQKYRLNLKRAQDSSESTRASGDAQDAKRSDVDAGRKRKRREEKSKTNSGSGQGSGQGSDGGSAEHSTSENRARAKRISSSAEEETRQTTLAVVHNDE